MKADPRVVSDLQKAANLECPLQLQYHLDRVLLHDMELDEFAEMVDAWGEDGELILKKISRDLIVFRVDPKYSGGEPVAQKNLTDLFRHQLTLEEEIYAHYGKAYANALDADDNQTGHDIKNWAHLHRKHIRKLERKLRQIANFGEKPYALEMIE